MLNLFQVSIINNCKVFISPCPTGKDKLASEIKSLENRDSLIISLLEENEMERLHLTSEKEICEEVGIAFFHFPIRDMSIPSYKSFVTLIDELFQQTKDLQNIIIHCKHGIGRSGLIALGLMIRNGEELKSSISSISKIRGFDIPQSISQRKLLSAYYTKLTKQ